LRLEYGCKVSGFVFDKARNPIEGVEIIGKPANKGDGFIILTSDGSPLWKCVTDADGFYRVQGLPGGKASITAKHDDYVNQTVSNFKIHVGEETNNVSIELEFGEVIAGCVMDGDGKPVVGAKVSINNNYNFDSGIDFSMGFDSARGSKDETDENGEFMLKGLKIGEFTVQVKANGFVSDKAKKIKSGVRDLDFMLKKCGLLAGRIVNFKTGEGINDFDIKAQKSFYNKPKSEILKGKSAVDAVPELQDPSGAYCIQGLQDGNYSLAVSAEGYGDQTIKEAKAKAGHSELNDFKMKPESTISGVIQTPDKKPLEGGEVTITRDKGRKPNMMQMEVFIEESGSDVFINNDRWKKKAKSGKNGEYIIKGLPPGDFKLVASHPEHTESELQKLTLKVDNHVKNINFTCSEAGSITGKVFTADGSTKSGAKVIATPTGRSIGFSGMKSAISKKDGDYSIRHLEPGDYKVHIGEDDPTGSFRAVIWGSSDGDDATKPGEYRVTVESGVESKLDLFETLKCGVTGAVTEAGRPVENMNVKIFQGGENGSPMNFMPLKTDVTGRNGSYSFEGLKPGSYRICAECRGLPESIEEDVVLTEGVVSRLDLNLPTGKVSGRITDSFTGAPLANINVSLKKAGNADETNTISSSVGVYMVNAIGEGDDGETFIFGGGPQKVKTDKDGYFVISFVKDGEYKLEGKGKGYSTGHRDVTVEKGKESAHQDIKLSSGFTISGKVIDGATGKPAKFYVPLLYIKLKDGKDSEGEPEFINSFGRGQFKIKNLKQGDYRIKVASESEHTGSLDFNITNQDLENMEVIVSQK